MRKLLCPVLLLVLFASVTEQAFAAPVTTGTYSGLPVLIDSTTGLYWLNLSETTDLSNTAALADFSSFSIATNSQVLALFSDAGVPEIGTSTFASESSTVVTNANTLIADWGFTISNSTSQWSDFFDADSLATTSSGFHYYGTVQTTSNSIDTFTAADGQAQTLYPSSGVGWALVIHPGVASVPEPSSLMLLVTGLIGLSTLRVRKM